MMDFHSGRTRSLLLLLSAVAMLLALSPPLIPQPAGAQSDGPHVFNPPVKTIEISGREPLLDAVTADLSYGGGGGCGDIICGSREPGPLRWAGTQAYVYAGESDVKFGACGYGEGRSTPPTATLITPDGTKQALMVTGSLMDAGSFNDCFQTDPFPTRTGMLLGTYTLQFAHAEGTLTQQFLFDYPRCRLMTDTADGTLVAGLLPNERFSIHVYTYTITEDIHFASDAYVATR